VKSQKASLFLVLMIFSTQSIFAQSPVTWTFRVIPEKNGILEIHFKATLKEGWHIYSQQQPVDAVCSPTKIKYTPNPILLPEGQVKEVGQLIHYEFKTIGIKQDQYNREVDFVQRIRLKYPTASTKLSGMIHYQICTDIQCLPPTEIPFEIPVSPSDTTK